jgi:magnesium-transporting ATPase (P-type)
MTIFGKSLSEYVSFEKGFLILILVVGLGRLCLSLAGAPVGVVKFASMTVLMLLGLIYYSVRVHTSGFGSYKQLLPVLALQVILINLITISGIVLAIETGRDNIFTVPEFSPNKANGRTWGHAGMHLVAMVVLPFVLWAVGALIMLVTKKLTAGGQSRTGTVGA